jgi:hypothetical protein
VAAHSSSTEDVRWIAGAPSTNRRVSRVALPELVLVPSRQVVFDLAWQFGFESVALAHEITDFAGMEDYRSKQRAAFICSKSIPLDAVASEKMDAFTLPRAGLEKRPRRELKRAQQRAGRR